MFKFVEKYLNLDINMCKFFLLKINKKNNHG